MATKDNSLGAPAEGFGQTVTFAFRPDNNTPQTGAVQQGRVNVGVQGGNADLTTHAQGVQVQSDPTMAVLMKIAGEALAPMIKQRQQERYVAGMQRAMQGEAVTDIANSDPWYARIFGDSDTVEGARAYTAHAKVSEQMAKIEDSMADVRKLPPGEAQKFFTDQVQQAMTGDKATDMVTMQALAKQMPSIMRRQAKEHYGWQQEQAAASESKAIASGADALQRAALAAQPGLDGSPGTVTPEEFDAQKRAYANLALPAVGRDPENWRKARTKDLVLMAANEQLHAINAFKSIGLFSQLSPEQQTQVETAIDKAESRVRSRMAYDFSDDKAKIIAQAHMPVEGQTVPDVTKQATILNEKMMARYGTKVGIFSPEEMTIIAKDTALAIAQEKNRQAAILAQNAKAAATAGQKALTEQKKVDFILGEGFTHLRGLAALPDYSEEKINAAVIPRYNELDPSQRLDFLKKAYSGDGFVIKPIAEGKERAVEALVSGGEGVVKDYNAGAQAAYAEWKQMHDYSPEMAASYYGKQAPRLAKLDALIQAKIDPKDAWLNAMLQPLNPPKIDHKVFKATADELLKQQPGWVMGTLSGAIPLTEEAKQLIDNMAGHTAELWSTSQTPEVAAKIGIRKAMSDGTLTVLGGHAWAKQKAQPDLASYLAQTHDGKLAVPTDTASEVVRDAIDTVLYGSGKTAGIIPQAGFHVLKTKADSVNVYQSQDDSGQPTLHILATVNGEVRGAVLPFNRVFDMYHQQQEARKARGVMRRGTMRETTPFVGGDQREFPPTN